MPSVLFVCVHNACRSQIAEAIARSLAPASWQIASAGSNPSSEVDPKAIEILKNYGLVMSAPKPKGFGELPLIQWDVVAGMGCGESCPSVLSRRFIEWKIPDPEDGPMLLYQALYDDLSSRIRKLIQEIQES